MFSDNKFELFDDLLKCCPSRVLMFRVPCRSLNAAILPVVIADEFPRRFLACHVVYTTLKHPLSLNLVKLGDRGRIRIGQGYLENALVKVCSKFLLN